MPEKFCSDLRAWCAAILAAIALYLPSVSAADGACGTAPAQQLMGARTTPRLLSTAEAACRLAAAYPGRFRVGDDAALIWDDGSVMPIAADDPDDALGAVASHLRPVGAGKSDRRAAYQRWLSSSDLRAMFADPYPALPSSLRDGTSRGAAQRPALADFADTAMARTPPLGDPGRSRPARFFDQLYGTCQDAAMRSHLVAVNWLPGVFGGSFRVVVTRLQGVARRVQAISNALEKLPKRFHRFLRKPGGGFACRFIAGTRRRSAHAYGIAIDIGTARADYWRWRKRGRRINEKTLKEAYRNRIPLEIVSIFEAHGFIWGGRWRHFDTMHFEYRPELLLPQVPLSALPPLAFAR